MRPQRVTPRVRARLKFAVVSGGRAAAGKVYVRKANGAVIGRDTLNALGKARFRIQRLKAGTHRLRIVYTGSARSLPATRTLVIKVRNRR